MRGIPCIPNSSKEGYRLVIGRACDQHETTLGVVAGETELTADGLAVLP